MIFWKIYIVFLMCYEHLYSVILERKDWDSWYESDISIWSLFNKMWYIYDLLTLTARHLKKLYLVIYFTGFPQDRVWQLCFGSWEEIPVLYHKGTLLLLIFFIDRILPNIILYKCWIHGHYIYMYKYVINNALGLTDYKSILIWALV